MAAHRSGRATAWWIALGLAAVLAPAVLPQRTGAQTPAGNDLDVVQLRPNFYLFAGAGGNIVMQTGPVGVILVDSGSARCPRESWPRSGS
jgi:hypothetical protein